MKNLAYKSTSVNWAKTQTAIVKMLTQRKIFQTRFTNMENKFAVEFLAPQENMDKPIGVRVVVPFIYSGDNEEKRQRELNRLHRVLFYHLKAKFVAIDSGLTEFMEEFMPHLIVMDKKGNSTTLGQMLLPQYKNSLESGEQKDFKLLGDGN
ncbi:MAG: hypothetical protein AABY22_33155 [Nanoarchaeota archaeon]